VASGESWQQALFNGFEMAATTKEDAESSHDMSWQDVYLLR